MSQIHDLIRSRIEQKAGLVDPPKPAFAGVKFEDLVKTEWSQEFETLMRNRMVMGAMRYGLLAKKKSMKKKYDLLGGIKAKIEKYEETGNTEYLVDIANYCLIAFEADDHPKKHFHALDDHHDHCKMKS